MKSSCVIGRRESMRRSAWAMAVPSGIPTGKTSTRIGGCGLDERDGRVLRRQIEGDVLDVHHSEDRGRCGCRRAAAPRWPRSLRPPPPPLAARRSSEFPAGADAESQAHCGEEHQDGGATVAHERERDAGDGDEARSSSRHSGTPRRRARQAGSRAQHAAEWVAAQFLGGPSSSRNAIKPKRATPSTSRPPVEPELLTHGREDEVGLLSRDEARGSSPPRARCPTRRCRPSRWRSWPAGCCRSPTARRGSCCVSWGSGRW